MILSYTRAEQKAIGDGFEIAIEEIDCRMMGRKWHLLESLRFETRDRGDRKTAQAILCKALLKGIESEQAGSGEPSLSAAALAHCTRGWRDAYCIGSLIGRTYPETARAIAPLLARACAAHDAAIERMLADR